MKNEKITPLLKVIEEVLELESECITTTLELVEIKGKIEAKVEKIKESLENDVKFTDEEKELMRKAQGKSDTELVELENENVPLAESVKDKNLTYMKLVQELMDKDSKLKLGKIDKTKLPDKLKGKQIEILSILF